jgi:hypothetical protein
VAAAAAIAGWGNATNVSASAGDARGPAVAIDSQGAALAVWTESRTEIKAAEKRATWGSPFAVSAGGGLMGPADVALNGLGDAVVVWDRFDGAGYTIQAASRSGNRWSAPSAISALFVGAGSA